MNNFQSGKRDGYIYGYIFSSGKVGLVLDEGPREYPIKSAELLIDGEFVFMENITLETLHSKGIYGAQARIKDDNRQFYVFDKA